MYAQQYCYYLIQLKITFVNWNETNIRWRNSARKTEKQKCKNVAFVINWNKIGLSAKITKTEVKKVKQMTITKTLN